MNTQHSLTFHTRKPNKKTERQNVSGQILAMLVKRKTRPTLPSGCGSRKGPWGLHGWRLNTRRAVLQDRPPITQILPPATRHAALAEDLAKHSTLVILATISDRAWLTPRESPTPCTSPLGWAIRHTLSILHLKTLPLGVSFAPPLLPANKNHFPMVHR